MYIYSEDDQMKRAESICSLLEKKDLSKWARTYWSTVLTRLANGQEQLEYSFRNTKNVIKS